MWLLMMMCDIAEVQKERAACCDLAAAAPASSLSSTTAAAASSSSAGSSSRIDLGVSRPRRVHLRCTSVESSVIRQMKIFLFAYTLLELSKHIIVDVSFVTAALEQVLRIGISAASILPWKEVGTDREHNGVSVGVGVHRSLRG